MSLWSLAAGICSNSAPRALVRSGDKAGLSARIQIHPEGDEWGEGQSFVKAIQILTQRPRQLFLSDSLKLKSRSCLIEQSF